MQINQSRQLLQYCQQYPIRLLSLPIEQTYMIKRLRLSKQRTNWYADLGQSAVNSNKVRSLRLQRQIGGSNAFQNDINHQSKSVQIAPAIHSRSRKNIATWKQIYKKNRYSVLKHFMKQGDSLERQKINQDIAINQFEVSKLLKISNKPVIADKNMPNIYRNHIKKHNKEKQFRHMFIFDRVNQSPKLNTVVRKLVGSKRIPPL